MGKVYDGIIRTTFVIDENGFILHIINKVKTKKNMTPEFITGFFRKNADRAPGKSSRQG